MAHATLQELTGSDQLTLIDFSAEWCGPCKMMAPILEEVKSSVGDKVRIVKIDIDRNPTVALNYHVRSVPTLMMFRKGTLLWRQSGVAQPEQLKNLIDQYNKS